MQELVTGIYGSLLVFPLNLFIVYIFRNSRFRESASLRLAKKKTAEYEAKKRATMTKLEIEMVEKKKPKKKFM